MTLYTATTEDIKVNVRAIYLDGQSDILARKFVFAYFVRIENRSKEPVKLLRRHWYIHDSGGDMKEVEGEGVIGKTPVIKPEDAREHPNVHVIRRYLGSLKLPEVDFRLKLSDNENSVQATKNQGLTLQPEEILLLCSDGLTDMVWVDEIHKTIVEAASLKAGVQKLVAQANERGGHDNITVILISIPKPRPPEEKKKGIMGWLMGE
ncbi:MAG: ApaG domain [Ignavibacteriae bacterium]|nr:ApaG domain [Ignavibacteriota bacterium]